MSIKRINWRSCLYSSTTKISFLGVNQSESQIWSQWPNPKWRVEINPSPQHWNRSHTPSLPLDSTSRWVDSILRIKQFGEFATQKLSHGFNPMHYPFTLHLKTPNFSFKSTHFYFSVTGYPKKTVMVHTHQTWTQQWLQSHMLVQVW